MARAPLKVVGEPSHSSTTADQIAEFDRAKSLLSSIERTVCSSFSTPASRLQARRAAAELITAARQLERSLA